MRFISKIAKLAGATVLASAVLVPSATLADSTTAFQELVQQYPAYYQTLHNANISDATLQSFLNQLQTTLQAEPGLSQSTFDSKLIHDAFVVSGSDSTFQSKLLSLFTTQELLEAASGVVPSNLIPVRNIMFDEWQSSTQASGGSAGGGSDTSSGDLYTIAKGTDGTSAIALNETSVLQVWSSATGAGALQVKLPSSTVPYELPLSQAILTKGKALKQSLQIVADKQTTVIPFAKLPNQPFTLLIQPTSSDSVASVLAHADLKLVGAPASIQLADADASSATPVLQGYTYAQTRIVLPADTDLQSLGAYVIDSQAGQDTPVPFTVETAADGTRTAVIQHLGTGTFALAERSVQFSDLKSHWSAASVQMLATRGILSGYADGTFRPEQTVTRAEFAAMLTRALGILTTGTSHFPDVSSGTWYNAAVTAASEAQLISGDDQGHFRPDDVVTRQEAAAMMANAVHVFDAQFANRTDVPFANISISDKAQVPSWAQASVAEVVSLQLMKGDENGAFHPTELTTRGQAAAMLTNLLYAAGLATK